MWGRQKNKVDVDKLSRQATDAIEQVKARESRIEIMANFFKARDKSNGFGEDFEYTLMVKGYSDGLDRDV